MVLCVRTLVLQAQGPEFKSPQPMSKYGHSCICQLLHCCSCVCMCVWVCSFGVVETRGSQGFTGELAHHKWWASDLLRVYQNNKLESIRRRHLMACSGGCIFCIGTHTWTHACVCTLHLCYKNPIHTTSDKSSLSTVLHSIRKLQKLSEEVN